MAGHPQDKFDLDTEWKILIIDDDEEDYLIARDMLAEARGRKISLEWASTYEAGRQALLTRAYHAVLVDYDLGPRSGIALIREACGWGYASPLILYTGRGGYEIDVEAMQAGATLYLAKDEVTALTLERFIRYAIERKRIEQERADILESIQDGFYSIDRNWNITFISRQAAHNGGFEPADAIGRSIWEVFPNLLETPSVQYYHFAMENHRAVKFEMQGTGLGYWYAVSVYPSAGGISVYWTEITAQKQVAEALKESQARLVDFLESTHDNYLALDREWCFTYANRHYGEVMGMDPQELIGKNYWELFPQYLGTDLETYCRRAMADGKPFYFLQGGVYTGSLYEVSLYPTREGLSIFSVDRTEELRHQQRLEDERARLEAVLQAMPVAVWIAGEDGKISFKNRQADQIWGGDAPLPENVAGYREYVAWFLDSGKPVAAEEFPVARALKTGEAVAAAELRIQRFDGSEGAVLAIGAPIKDREGKLTGAVAINLDITERIRAEQELRENSAALRASENKYQAIFRSAPFSITLSRVSDGLITDVNPAMLELFGLTREEALGKNAVDLNAIVDLAARERGYAEMRAKGRLRNFEMPFRTSTGKTFIALNNAEVVEIDGVQYVLSTINDITERKQAEDELRRSEARLRKLIDSNIIGIDVRDADGLVKDANARLLNLIGYTPADLQAGRLRIKELTPPEFWPADKQAITEALETGSCQPYEKAFLHKDGSVVPAMVGYTRLDDTGEDLIGFVLDLTEVTKARTQIQEYAQMLKQSNQELEQFAFVASHDLQEPLRKIKLFGNMIQQRLNGKLDEETQEHFQRMLSASERMQLMIQDLLELSRINRQGRPFVTVDLPEVIAEVVSDLEPRILRTRGQVQVEALELPTIEADPIQLHQVLQNLVGNGLKFHKPDTEPLVKVSVQLLEAAKTRPEMVAIQVEDNGIGFEQEHFERILQPFQRLHGRSEYEGTGIGLAIVKKIIERHHGELSATSAPGEGATFTVMLPVKQN